MKAVITINNDKRIEKKVLAACKRYAMENRAESWFHVVLVLFCLIASYSILLFNTNTLVLLVGGLALAVSQTRFFAIYHDFVHKTILQKSIAATGLFTLFGLYILAPASIWHRSHNHHHQHNSKLNASAIGSYPIMSKHNYLKASKVERRRYLFSRHPATIFLGYFFTFVYGMCWQSFRNNFKKHWDSLLALLLHIALGTFLFFYGGLLFLIVSFFMPVVLSNALGAYLFYAQHNFPGVVHYSNENWSYYKAAIASSSYMKMNPAMQWITANIGYHHIHHINAAIPFYNLPKAYRSIPELKTEATTSLHPIEIYNCLRLKVWDEASNRMTGVAHL
ncbi:MAG TPA: fatty acid desaturase [Chitinophagaceae bacterium]|nr:fatty acid desaturase [Chitinophagaceae bacterium]